MIAILGFLVSPIGKIVSFTAAIVVGVGIVYGWGHSKGKHAERQRWEVAVEKEQKRQRAVVEKAIEWANAETKDAEAKAAESEKRVADYENELLSRHSDPVLSEPDARRLRDIQ